MDARNMAGPGNRQYHIGLAPGEVAEHILLCGDPGRVERFAAAHLDTLSFERRQREYVTVTGHCRGVPVTVMATGMGADNTEIALVELAAIQPRATLLRMGSCGALQPHVDLGDLVVTTGAVRLESTTLAYVPCGFPAFADADVLLALRSACTALQTPHHVGLTATAAGFYGAQARATGPFRPRHPDLVRELSQLGVLNLEMETSAVLTLAQLAGWRAGAVCAVYASRPHDTALDEAGRLHAEARCMAVAAHALRALAAG